MAKLKYTWQDNAATQDDPNDYYPRVVDLEYKTQDDLIKDIAVPGSILKDTELLAVKRRIFQQFATYIEQGYAYKDDDLTVKPGLGGIAYDSEAPWNDEQHSKNVSILPGKSLREAALQIELERVSAMKEAAVIEEIHDYKTEAINSKLTPGKYTLKIINTKYDRTTTLRTTLSEIALTVE